MYPASLLIPVESEVVISKSINGDDGIVLFGFLTPITVNLNGVLAARVPPLKNMLILILLREVKVQEVVEVMGMMPVHEPNEGTPISLGNPIVIISELTNGIGDVTVNV